MVRDFTFGVPLIMKALNEELFDTIDDARRKLALWRYDYNNVRPHSSLGNQTPAEAHRTLEQFDGTAHDTLAQNETADYKIQTRKLSLWMREPRGAGHIICSNNFNFDLLIHTGKSGDMRHDQMVRQKRRHRNADRTRQTDITARDLSF